ncbi:MAG: hypothetical protein K9M82_04425 [Deltaproteobacteria bacterium]|nr:hypothetical protein [Deltaproteobacteria bacterium]
MTEEKAGNKPDPERLEALRSLPGEVLDRLTKDEVKASLYSEDWPDSLKEKLGDYLVDAGE